MTPDQIAAIKIVLAMSPQQLEELRRNLNMFDNAVETIRHAMGVPTRGEVIALTNRLEDIRDDIAAMPDPIGAPADTLALLTGKKELDEHNALPSGVVCRCINFDGRHCFHDGATCTPPDRKHA